MEPAVDREFTALGGLFQHIITDLKNSAPVWEDFLVKASKLHSQLKATILSSTSFLDSFQKIADMATNTRGATKEIGSALTRLCLRQRSVEARLKTFSNSLQESLVLPLQEKLEDWKKMANYLDKEHAKEFKKVRQDLKKKSSDTLRLQKKVRKVGVYDIRRTLDYALQDVTDKYLLLEETEKQSVRKALIEERSHFCVFVGYLQPVLEAELTMLHEINHLQEIVDTLSQITGDPHLLPSTSEQVISDIKSSENTWSFQTPPSSPGSLGSRKSSVCSISSINSSSSGSLKSSHSKQLSHFQPKFGALQLASVSSQDSGFTSQDTLFMNSAMSPLEISHQLSTFAEMGSTTSSTPSSPLPSVTSTWPNLQDTEQYEKQPSTLLKFQRPHTISSAYEKNNHSRPALTAHTFQPLDIDSKSDSDMGTCTFRCKEHRNYNSQPGTPIYTKPIIPGRNEALKKKPSLPEKSPSVKAKHSLVLMQHCTSNKSVPDFNKTPADQVVPHPIYANARELLNNKESRNEENPYSMGNNRELQSQKELAAVLKEGLQCLKLGSDNLSPSPPSVPARLKLGRPACGGSETLPRSRGSFCEEDISQWQMSSMTFVNCNNYSYPYGAHRRPMSIAGISAELLVPPRKANTLQRVGSSGYKPPTPVRRSSSITTPTSQSRASNENLSIKRSDSSVSSGAGEVRYSPNFTELSKNSSPLSQSASPPEKPFMFKHNLDKNRKDYHSSSDTYPVNGRDTETENNIVTDVSDSRARLIQDLNCTLQQQRKLLERKSSFSEAPSVPPRHSSKQDRCETNNRNVHESCVAENTLYGTIGRPEEQKNRSGDKIGANRTFSKQAQRKNSMLELPSHRNSCWNSKETPPHVPQRHSSQFSTPVKLSAPTQELPSDDKSIKQCFMAALNAKLAQQQNTKAEDEVCAPHWQSRNNKNLISNHWPPGNTHYSESLMDQIKRGTTLRKVASNDRSAPRLA